MVQRKVLGSMVILLVWTQGNFLPLENIRFVIFLFYKNAKINQVIFLIVWQDAVKGVFLTHRWDRYSNRIYADCIRQGKVRPPLPRKGRGGRNAEKRVTGDTVDQPVFWPVSRCVRLYGGDAPARCPVQK